MVSKAAANFVRISPRKVRYVIDLIRRKRVSEAQAILSGSPRRAGEIVRKLLDQAIDAAEKNSKIGSDNLMVSKVLADGGPSMRRFRAASMGRAALIKKRTSHIYLELDFIKPGVLGAAPKPKAVAIKKRAAVTSGHKKMVGAK